MPARSNTSQWTRSTQRRWPFWCGLLGVEVDATIGEGEFLVLSPTEDGLTLGFQRVPEARQERIGYIWILSSTSWTPQWWRLSSSEAMVTGTTRELEGFRWRCMADPEGNEFDLDVLPPES